VLGRGGLICGCDVVDVGVMVGVLLSIESL
jgi:hypothetical protein